MLASFGWGQFYETISAESYWHIKPNFITFTFVLSTLIRCLNTTISDIIVHNAYICSFRVKICPKYLWGRQFIGKVFCRKRVLSNRSLVEADVGDDALQVLVEVGRVEVERLVVEVDVCNEFFLHLFQ
jgi:hypothetical protein